MSERVYALKFYNSGRDSGEILGYYTSYEKAIEAVMDAVEKAGLPEPEWSSRMGFCGFGGQHFTIADYELDVSPHKPYVKGEILTEMPQWMKNVSSHQQEDN